jgi:CheY-like chemotaxis protein
MTPSTQPSLLLIANHPQFTYLLERYGERSGCRFSSADSIDKAVEQMRRDRPAIVLLHLNLTGWSHDGWPILHHLKQHCATHDIPIAIISAIVDEARARAEGAAYWLWQPVMYDDFLSALVATGVLPPHPATLYGSEKKGV